MNSGYLQLQIPTLIQPTNLIRNTRRYVESLETTFGLITARGTFFKCPLSFCQAYESKRRKRERETPAADITSRYGN